MNRKHASIWLGMSVAAMLLGGCGANPMAAMTGRAAQPGQFAAARPGMKQDDLGLSDDQKKQLKAIADKYKPAKPAQPADLRKLLTAATIDESALRSALQQEQTFRKTMQDNALAALSEERAVYTDDQRAKMVARLQAIPEPKAPHAAPKAPHQSFDAWLSDKLKLTDEQKATLASLKPTPASREAQLADKLKLSDEQKAALAALKPEAPPKFDPAAEKQAMIAFWQNGDTSGLKKPAPADKTDALVAAAKLLSADQRKALFGRGFGGPGIGGPGGPGFAGPGRPGMGGPGGPGFGGPGGPG